jgi:hypothetical protein
MWPHDDSVLCFALHYVAKQQPTTFFNLDWKIFMSCYRVTLGKAEIAELWLYKG